MAQGLVGFVLGVIVTAVLLASEPRLLGDVRDGLHDLRHDARQVVSERGDRYSSDRRYEDRHGRDLRDDR